MPSLRALLTAAVPGLLIFADFTFWMAFSPAFALVVGATVSAAALVVTRLLYDDATDELAAWQAAAPDLAEPAGRWSPSAVPTSPAPPELRR